MRKPTLSIRVRRGLEILARYADHDPDAFREYFEDTWDGDRDISDVRQAQDWVTATKRWKEAEETEAVS